MGKEVSYRMSKNILEMSVKPLRRRQEAVLLILYTIRMFGAEGFLQEDTEGKIVISISKMNRIFYVMKNKIFSMQFPFRIEIKDEKIARIYDARTGLDIDLALLSALIGVFEKSKEGKLSFDYFFDEIMNNENISNHISAEQLWEIVRFLSSYDLGYLRYDYDEEHQNGKLHPLNHLDLYLDSAAACKIGLESDISYGIFKDILDTTTDCAFLKI